MVVNKMIKYVRENSWREDPSEFLKSIGFKGPARYYVRQRMMATMMKMAKEDERICFIGADMNPKGYISQGIPEARVINVGIAEANATVVASGFAKEGFTPIWMSMSWLFGRAYNQIFQSIGIDNHNVKFIGYARGWAGGGASHHEINDIGFMRGIPQILCMAPADAVELEKTIIAGLKYKGATFIRVHSQPVTNLFEEDYPFKIGKAITVREGDDVSIISFGIQLWRSLTASDMLAEEGISARVINMSTLKPLDDAMIAKAAKETGAVVTAEDHTLLTGVGESIARVVVKSYPVPMELVGIRDLYSQSIPEKGDQWPVLEKAYHLTAKDIVAAAKKAVQRKKR
jgi:transketolase